MLVPAILFKNQIERYSDELRYSEKMMFYNGCTETGRIQISIDPTEGRYQWAIIDENENLIGYISYMIDYFSSNIYGFGLIAFSDNKQLMASGILEAIRHIKKMNAHRIEWRCVSDNPASYGYDKIIEFMAKSNYICHKHNLTDTFKDAYGKYHSCIIYELIKED